MNLSRSTKAIRVLSAAAAGSGDTLVGSAVDMKGFDAVEFVTLLGLVLAGASATLQAQQSSDNGAADAWADLEDTGVAAGDGDDDKLIRLDIDQPRERYIRPALVRANADVAVDGIIAILYKADKEPIDQDATVAAAEYHLAPGEGAAA